MERELCVEPTLRFYLETGANTDTEIDKGIQLAIRSVNSMLYYLKSLFSLNILHNNALVHCYHRCVYTCKSLTSIVLQLNSKLTL